MSSVNKIILNIAAVSVVLTLGGCASGSGSTGASLGSGSGDGSGGSVTTLRATRTAVTTSQASNIVSATGDAISNTGSDIGSLDLPIVPDQTQTDLANVVVNAGGIVSTLGAGIDDGLGQMGLITNPVGTVVASTSNVIGQTGVTVQSAGQLVSNLGSDQLAPLAPLTTPVGGLVTRVGEVVSDSSGPLQSVLSSIPVEQITQPLSNAIVPITSQLTMLTESVGTKTGLGQPIHNLLVTVGGKVATVGGLIEQSNVPVVENTGGVVVAVGNTVASIGSWVTPSASPEPTGLSNILSSLADPSGNTGSPTLGASLNATLNVVVSGSLSGGTTGTPNLIAPLTNTVTALVGGSVGNIGGLKEGVASNHVLAPVTSIVSAVVTPIVAPIVSGGGTSNVLAPVTNLTNGLLGKIASK